jgi:hypothetical protein
MDDKNDMPNSKHHLVFMEEPEVAICQWARYKGKFKIGFS